MLIPFENAIVFSEDVKQWLKDNLRFHMHCTPTNASRMDMVERFFRDLAGKCLRRRVSRSVPDVVAAINQYASYHNQDPKPFI